MKTQVFITFLLLGVTLQQCSIGCLKCSSLNQCMLCDTTNSYYLSAGSCQLSTLLNCSLLSQAGSCVQCNTGYYLDVNSQKCLAVSSTNAISNCVLYNSAQTCTSCSGNFFIFAGRCSAVNITISNCQTYSANGVCATCTSGYLISNDFTSCVTLPTGTNCLYYTFIGCKQCNNGFSYNQNNYFTSFTSMNYIQTQFLAYLVNPYNSWIGLNVCQAQTVTNCLVFSAFNFCTQCSSGYFLQNGNCVAFPLPIIFGCLNYSTLVTCATCQPGMYLSQNLCLNNAVIANCLVYSGSASATTCTACVTGFYLQGNACVARSISASIQNCLTVSVTSDYCATCVTGFILSTDNRACLASIANCNSYSSSTYQTTTLTCSLCNNGFYLSSSGSTTICVAGTVQFCLVYSINSNTCTQCSNGYYLANNVCTAHVVIPNCLTYNLVQANYCSVCNSGYYNFAYTTVCVQTTVKTGCSSYSVDGNSCVTCASGYYLASGNCNLIPSTYANCNTFSGSVCTLCNTGYMVNTLPTVGTCTLPLDYITSTTTSPCSLMIPLASTVTATWLSSATATQAPLTCGTCNSYMYGYAPQGAEAICVNSSQIAMYSGYVAVSQCARYGMNYATSQVIVCMQCASGYFISGYQSLAENTVATTCVSSCTAASTNSNAVIPDDFQGFVNICVPYVAAAGSIRFSGTCQRFGRTSGLLITNAATAGNDYKCIIAAPSSATIPTNYLLYPTPVIGSAATQLYQYEAPSATSQVTTSIDFTSGYSNTVDSTSVFPTVFNYHGILPVIADSAVAIVAANLPGNNLNNCDIVVVYGASYTFGGYGSKSDVNFVWGTYFQIIFTNAYNSCLRCNFGYQLSYVLGASAATNPNYPSCVQMSNCASSTTVYGGLPTFLNTLFSCHVCSQSGGLNTFPSIYLETAKTYGIWTGWTIKNVYNGAGTSIANANHGFRCAAAPSVVTQTDHASNTAAITNCAAYAYVTVITTPVAAAGPPPADPASSGPFTICVACVANYFPTYLGTAPAAAANSILGTTFLPTWVVSSCTASVNCDTSVVSQFNSCGKCRSDLENAVTPAYYAFLDFTLTNCYQAFSQNCFVLATGFSTSATNNVCLVCKAGYFMNSDSVCEVYKVPNESTTSGTFVNAYFVSKIWVGTTFTVLTAATDPVAVRYHYLLSYKKLQYGVSSCTSGWIQAPVNPWAPRVCVWSSYVYNITGSYPSTTVFVNNCVKYNLTMVSSKNVCGGCNSGYIPTNDGLACVSSTGLPNCVYSQTGSNTGLCYQCAANFYNVNGQCVATTITNCATYVNTLWSFTTPGTLQCATCLSGFYLSNDYLSCTAGNVINCISYSQGLANTCTACSPGYVLLSLTNVYYCYPIPASLNCQNLQDTSNTSGANFGTISCSTCVANSVQVYGARTWTTLGLTTQAQTMCMPFTAIANCVLYDQANSIIKSNSFSCLQCSSAYWYSSTNSTCVPRSNMPSQCLTYSLTSDVCTSCGSSSFLSVTGTQCVSYPNGIFQCNQYSSTTTCTQCNAGYFLSNNACVLSTPISNCNVYSANYTCSACKASYFLSNSTYCVIGTATNCATFSSLTACATCASGFGLQTTNGVTSCVLVSIANCFNATTIAPFTCQVCNSGYYPSSTGVCTAVAQTITNCVVYDSATTCVTCSSNTVLNIARTACNSTFYTSYIDPNCGQSFLISTPTCSQCALGSFFSNGTCTSCTNNTLSSGCLTCDPLNNNSCLVCKPTYYMNSLGACVIVNPTPTPAPTPNPTPTGTASLTKALALTFTLASLYFDRF